MYCRSCECEVLPLCAVHKCTVPVGHCSAYNSLDTFSTTEDSPSIKMTSRRRLEDGPSTSRAAPALLLLHASLEALLVKKMQALQHRHPLLPLRRLLRIQ